MVSIRMAHLAKDKTPQWPRYHRTSLFIEVTIRECGDEWAAGIRQVNIPETIFNGDKVFSRSSRRNEDTIRSIQGLERKKHNGFLSMNV